jgi:hypothetical protein|tara:strand:+ start:2244 stop:2780 length:537 start_codon:yes stop_codon:yes gene_type:complete
MFNKYKNKLLNIPSLIIGEADNVDFDTVELFSNFFIIGVNSSFFNYPNCDILILNNIKLIKKHSGKINGLRCSKICMEGENFIRGSLNVFFKKKTQANKQKAPHLYNNNCAQDLAIQVALMLGCRPILTAGIDFLPNYKNNKILSITSGEYNSVDPFLAYSRYNDKCKDKLDLLKRLI